MRLWAFPGYLLLFALTANGQTIRVNTNSDLVGATLSQPYSVTLTPAGGTGPYTFTLESGSLPAGVNISSGGTIAGTPTGVGSSNFTVRVTDASSNRVTKDFSLEVVATPLSIAPFNPTLTVGQPTSFTYSPSGGSAPYTFSIVSGTVPRGILGLPGTPPPTFTGTPSGTPGAYNIVVQVVDAKNRTATLASTITLNASASLGLGTPPTFTTGQDVDFDLSPSGGMVTPTVSGGGLPSGLNLTSGGRLRGVPTTAGATPVTFTVTSGSGASANFNRTITVSDAPTYQIVSSSILPTGVSGQSYLKLLRTSAPTPLFSFWTIQSGALPMGLGLESDSGAISGTPTETGTFSFVVLADAGGGVQATKAFSLTIAATQFQWTSSSGTPSGLEQNSASIPLNSFNLPSAGSPVLISGALPPGMSLSSAYVLSGTPQSYGFYSYTLEATAVDGQTVQKSFTTTVSFPESLFILDPTAAITPWALGARHTSSYPAQGGAHNARFDLLSGSLPPGITLNASGILSGTPTATGAFSYVVRLTDGQGSIATLPGNIDVQQAVGDLVITPASMPGAFVSSSYNQSLNWTQGTGEVGFSLFSGSPPPGISLVGLTVGGIPTAGGLYPFTVRATDTSGPRTGGPLSLLKDYSILVSGGPPPSLTSISPTSVTGGTAAFTLTAIGTNFTAGAVIVFNGTDLVPTTLQPGGNLTATVLAALITNPSTVPVRVRNADGQLSSPQTFVISEGHVITSLSPNPVAAGSGAFTLTVNGTGFDPMAIVTINGSNRTTTFINSTQVTAAMLATDVGTPGTPQIRVVNPPASQSAPFTLNVNTPPSISNISPASGTVGGVQFTLTVNGANFVSGAVVTFGGTDTTTTFVNSGQVTASIPASLINTTGPKAVRVRNPDGLVSNGDTFTVNGVAPVITSLSPPLVAAGSGALTLTVNGTGFDPMAVVTFNGSNRTTTFVNSTQVTAALTAGDVSAAGTPQIRVVNPPSIQSSPFTLNVNNPPSITTISPTGGAVGGAQFTLTVNGANFVSGAVVTFAGTDTTTVVVNSGQLTATIPPALINTTGPKSVQVRNPDGLLSNTNTFTVSPPGPVITSLNPPLVAAGSAGFVLTVNGTSFDSLAVVTFNGANRTTTFVNSTQLTALIPSADVATAGTPQIRVVNPAQTSNAATLSVNNAPSISNISPTGGTVGGVQFTLTVNGANFVSGAVVTFAGTDTTTVVVNSLQVTATIPALLINTTGPKTVQVRNPDGLLSNTDTFSVTAGSPVISSLSPPSIAAGSAGFILTVNGSSFVTSSVVTFGGSDLSTTLVNAGQLTALVPSVQVANAASVPVQVRNPGNVLSNTTNFSVNAAPTLTSINPASVAAGGPTFTLNVTGTGFQSGAVVTFNGTDLPTSFGGATALTASVTSVQISSPGSVTIRVRNPDSQISNTNTLQVASGPTITTLSPTSAVAGGAAFTLTVTGTNYQSGAVVIFNGTNLATTFVSGTQLTAQVTPGQIANAGTATVVVRNPDTQQSTAANFNINPPAAVLTSLMPQAITPEFALGGPTASVRILGQNFVPASLFGGSIASIDGIAVGTTFVSATEVVALVPVAQLQTSRIASIRVQNPSAANSNALPLSVRPLPVITSLNPTTKLTGDPQFTLTVAGTGFLDRVSAPTAGSAVTWNNTVLATTYVNGTQLTAVVPPNLLAQAGTAQIRVANVDGQTSAPAPFTIASPVPTLTQLTPNSIEAGTFDFNFAIIGENFRGDMIAEWDGIQLTTGLDSPTQMRAYVPAGLAAKAGAFPIVVRNASGVASNALDFTVRRANAPSITTIDPPTIPAGSPQLQVRITGLVFFPTTVAVFKDTPLTTLYVNPTQVIAVIPANLLQTAGSGTMIIRNVDGQESAPRNIFITGAGPQLISLTPNTVQAGSPSISLNVQGTGFQNGATVRWNGSDLQTLFNSATSLQAVVPPNLMANVGTATVVVRNPDNQSSGSLPFTVTSSTPAPQISSLTPSSTVAGGPSFTLNVGGANFQAGAVVRWNGQALPTTYSSATQLSAGVTASLIAAAGVASITIRNPDNQISAIAQFNVTQTTPPTVTSLAPSSVAAGGPGFLLTVNGASFVNGAVVRFNNQDLATTYVSVNQVMATVPAASIVAQGSASITVRNPDGVISNALPLAVTSPNAPSISSLNPNTVAAGSATFSLTVTGGNFVSGSVVRFGGQDLATTYNSPGQLTASVGAQLLVNAGTAAITVRNPDQQLSNAATLTITSILLPPPTLSTLSPNQLPVGTQGTTLILSGLNFRAGAVATWNGSPLSTTYVSATQLTAAVPPALLSIPGAATLQVRNPDNQLSGGLAYFIALQVPQITGLSPLATLAGTPELTLVVSGLNFRLGSTIRWNGSILPTTFISSTQLSANVLPASLLSVAGAANISVVNPDGQASSAVVFTVANAQPQISGVNPAVLGTGTPNAQLTVTGSNFHPLAQVRWNGIAMTTISGGSTQLTALVDAALIALPASAAITVRNPDSQVSNSMAVQVIESRQPDITQLTPASIAVNSRAFALLVKGNNYLNGSTVLWNGQGIETAYNTGQQLTANVPAALLTTIGAVNVTVRNPDAKTSLPAQLLIGEALRIISSGELPVGSVDERYEAALFATGGSRPYKWRLAADSVRLPGNLSLGEDGVIRGIPQASGNFVLNVEVVDGVGTIERLRTALVIRARELDITSTSPLPPATAGSPYSYRLTASGGTGASYLWSVVEGVLPDGLILNAQTGEISGMPIEPPDPASASEVKAGRAASVPVSFQFRIQVAISDRAPFRKQFELTVLPATGGFRITTLSPLTEAVQNKPVRLQIAAAGGRLPYAFTAQGRLPDGITFEASGVLAGVPTESGNYNLAISARDAAGSTATQSFEWRVGPPSTGPLITSGPLLPISGMNQPLVYVFEAAQGAQPFQWAITSGSLPAGLVFDPVQGRLSGSTVEEGIFRFTARVTDATGRVDSRVLELPVTATGEALQLSTTTLPGATLGRAYSAPLSLIGGRGPYTCTQSSGDLPLGLTFANLQIQGTATVPGSGTFTLSCVDTFGFRVTRDFTILVTLEALPSITVNGLPDSVRPGEQPQFTIDASGPYPAEIRGTLSLTFVPSPAVAGVDAMIRLITGGTSATFSIPANSTRAVFAGSAVMALQTGTVAGSATLSAAFQVAGQTVTAANRLDRSVAIVQREPVVNQVLLEKRAGGFTLNLDGFSTTREIAEGTIVLTPVPGRELQSSRFTVPLAAVFKAWYDSAASLPFGTQFRLALPFDGDPAAIQSLTLRLRNSIGESAEQRVNF